MPFRRWFIVSCPQRDTNVAVKPIPGIYNGLTQILTLSLSDVVFVCQSKGGAEENNKQAGWTQSELVSNTAV